MVWGVFVLFSFFRWVVCNNLQLIFYFLSHSDLELPPTFSPEAVRIWTLCYTEINEIFIVQWCDWCEAIHTQGSLCISSSLWRLVSSPVSPAVCTVLCETGNESITASKGLISPLSQRNQAILGSVEPVARWAQAPRRHKSSSLQQLKGNMFPKGHCGDTRLKMTSGCHGFTAVWLVKAHGSKPPTSLEAGFSRTSSWKSYDEF